MEVTYQEKSHQFSLMVVKGKGHNLLGRDLLMHFRLYRMENNWPGYVRKSKCQGRCSSKEV